VVEVSRSHPVELRLYGRHDLILARKSDEPIVGSEQQRNAVVGKQGRYVALPPPARGKRGKVLAEPPVHVVLTHNR
jgi:hypothetical protein